MTETISITSILISIFSLCISFYVAYKARKLNEKSLEVAAEQYNVRSMIDIDGKLIDKPELWAIYDSHPLAKTKPQDPLSVAKRQAFIYSHINLFEAIYGFYQKHMVLSQWEAWDRYIRYFMGESSEARAIFSGPRIEEIYTFKFATYIKGIIATVDKKGEEN